MNGVGRDFTGWRRVVVWCGAVLAAGVSLRADEVVLRNGSVTGVVQSITREGVSLAGAESAGMTNVTGISFDAEPVVAKPQGVVLTDGSVLSGVVQAIRPEEIRFRSTSLGPMVLAVTNVAAVYNGTAPRREDIQPAPAGKVRVVREPGRFHDGELFGGSASYLAVRGERGLEKVNWQDLWFVAFRETRGEASVVLRNGDRLGMPVVWRGKELAVTLPGREPAIVPLAGLAKVTFR